MKKQMKLKAKAKRGPKLSRMTCFHWRYMARVCDAYEGFLSAVYLSFY